MKNQSNNNQSSLPKEIIDAMIASGVHVSEISFNMEEVNIIIGSLLAMHRIICDEADKFPSLVERAKTEYILNMLEQLIEKHERIAKTVILCADLVEPKSKN